MKKVEIFSEKDIYFLVAGNMIGVGVFITPNWVASQITSSMHFILIWVIGAVIAISGGLSYAALAKTFPGNGGDYLYLQKTTRRFLALMFASGMLWFAFPGSIASLAMGAAQYTQSFLKLMDFDLLPGLISVPNIALFYIFLFLVININRNQTALHLQRIIVSLLILAAIFFIISSFFLPPQVHIEVSGYDASQGSNHWLMALLMCYFSYIGFASIGYVGGEINLHRKNLNRIMLLAVGSVSLLYLLLNVVYIRNIPFSLLQQEEAAALLAVSRAPAIIQVFVPVAIIGAALGSLNVVMITGGRLFEYIFRDNLQDRDRPFFNSTLLLISVLGIYYLYTNSFGKILSGTVWIILFFSFITMAGFLLYRIRNNQKTSVEDPFLSRISIWFFTFSSGVLSIFGVIHFREVAFKGFLFVLIGFLSLLVIFYSRFGKNLIKIGLMEGDKNKK